MAITWGRISDRGRAATFRDDGSRQYTVPYKVLTDSVGTGQLEIFASLPADISYYNVVTESDRSALARSVQMTQTDDPKVWIVEITYDNRFTPINDANNARRDREDIGTGGLGGTGSGVNPSGGIGSAANVDPVKREPEIRFSFTTIREAVLQDYAGAAVVASNGEAYNPPLELDLAIPTLIYTRNERTFSALVAQNYVNTINKEPWGGVLKYQALMKNISAEVQYEGRSPTPYWRVTYEVWFRNWHEEGWLIKVRDEGTYERLANGTTKTILDTVTHLPITTPYPLNKAGLKLPDASILAGAFKFNQFRMHRQTKFQKLKLLVP